ncbi:MAG: nucleotidyltransferase domain-containing protein [Candidatus Odinarchaeota archaeon]
MTKVKLPSNGKEMANFLKKRLENLFKKKSIDIAFLGGSWSKDRNIWNSDIDIFISYKDFLEVDSKAQLFFLTTLSIKIEELTNFQEIEVSVLEILPLHVQFNVVRDGILLYERLEGVKAKYLEELLPRYYDHIIWYRNMLKQSRYFISEEEGN